MCKEEGIQQAFRKNGALYANYEARAGRIFGLKRTALCYDLEGEKLYTKNNTITISIIITLRTHHLQLLYCLNSK